MQKKQFLVFVIIMMLLLSSTVALASDKKGKEKEDKNQKDKNKVTEPKTKKENSENPDKELKSKEEKNKPEPENKHKDTKKDKTPKPTEEIPKLEYMAKGTIDAYVDVYSSIIVEGSWQVTLRDDQVEYKAKYIEENLDETIERSPIGSKDIFWHTFTVESYSFDGKELEFTGTLHVEKLWSKMDGSKEKVRWDTYPVTITINSESFFLDSPPAGEGPGFFEQDWDRIGTTEKIKGDGIDTTEKIKGVDEASELSLFTPVTTTVICYVDNTGVINYEIQATVYVYSKDTIEDIAHVYMITPDDTYRVELGLRDPNEPHDTIGCYGGLLEWLPDPILGTYTFMTEDLDGNTAEIYADVNDWTFVPVESFKPGNGEHFTDLFSMKWDIKWGPDPPVINGYSLGLYYHDEKIASYEFSSDEVILCPLSEGHGLYSFDIYCDLPEIEGHVKLIGHFFNDPIP